MVDLQWADRWAEEAVERLRPPIKASSQIIDISEKFTEVLWKDLNVPLKEPADPALATAHSTRITDDVLGTWKRQKEMEAALAVLKREASQAFIDSTRHSDLLQRALECTRLYFGPASPRPSEVLGSDLSDDDLSDTEEFMDGTMECALRGFQVDLSQSLLVSEKEGIAGDDELIQLMSPRSDRSSSSAIRDIFGKALLDLDDNTSSAAIAPSPLAFGMQDLHIPAPLRQRGGAMPALDVEDDIEKKPGFFNLDGLSPKSDMCAADSLVEAGLPDTGEQAPWIEGQSHQRQTREAAQHTQRPPQVMQLKSLKELGVQVNLGDVPSPGEAERLPHLEKSIREAPPKDLESTVGSTAAPSTLSPDTKLFSSDIDPNASFGLSKTASSLDPAFEKIDESREESVEPSLEPDAVRNKAGGELPATLGVSEEQSLVSEAKEGSWISVSMTLNIDYQQLSEEDKVQLQGKIRNIMAKTAEGAAVSVTLTPGSVRVDIKIITPDANSAKSMEKSMESVSNSIAADVVEAANSIPGVKAAAIGELKVTSLEMKTATLPTTPQLGEEARELQAGLQEAQDTAKQSPPPALSEIPGMEEAESDAAQQEEIKVPELTEEEKQLQRETQELAEIRDERRYAVLEMQLQVISQVLSPLVLRIEATQREKLSKSFAVLCATRPALDLRLESGAERLQCIGERIMLSEVLKTRRALCMLQARAALALTVESLGAFCKTFAAQKLLQKLAIEDRIRQQKEEEEAALMIQLQIRRRNALRREREMLAMLKIQRAMKRWIRKRRQDRRNASLIITSLCRAVISTTRLLLLRKRDVAATKIQRFIRKKQQRAREEQCSQFLRAYLMTMHCQQNLLHLREEQDAAICIQIEFRRIAAVKEKQELRKQKQQRDAARKIQKAWRRRVQYKNECVAKEVIGAASRVAFAQHFVLEARKEEQRRKEGEAAHLIKISAKTSYCQDNLARLRCADNLRRVRIVIKVQRRLKEILGAPGGIREKLEQRRIQRELEEKVQREREEAATKVIHAFVASKAAQIRILKLQEMQCSISLVQSSWHRYMAQRHLLELKKVAFGPFTSVFLDAVRLGSRELEQRIIKLVQKRQRSFFAHLKGEPDEDALRGGSAVTGVPDLLAHRRDLPEGEEESYDTLVANVDHVPMGYDDFGEADYNGHQKDGGWLDQTRGVDRPGSRDNLPSINSNRGWAESIGVGVQTEAVSGSWPELGQRSIQQSLTAPDFHHDYLERGQQKTAMGMTSQFPAASKDINSRQFFGGPLPQNPQQVPPGMMKTTSLPSLFPQKGKSKAKSPSRRASSLGKKSRRRQDRGGIHLRSKHKSEQGKSLVETAHHHSHHHHHYHIFMQAKKNDSGEVEWRPSQNQSALADVH